MSFLRSLGLSSSTRTVDRLRFSSASRLLPGSVDKITLTFGGKYSGSHLRSGALSLSSSWLRASRTRIHLPLIFASHKGNTSTTFFGSVGIAPPPPPPPPTGGGEFSSFFCPFLFLFFFFIFLCLFF